MKVVTKELFQKSPTGISGLDEITGGGFPKGRPTLICGSAGCGKTLFGIQYLVKGITDYNEPGVLMTFEESSQDITTNVKSLGFDLDALKAKNKLRIDYVRIERSEIEETGEYDLEALFIRLNHAIDTIGAKRVVLDTIEALFVGMTNLTLLRSEIRRLFNWLKEKGVTAVVTGESGENSLTRQGLEEYVSDCVILLDFRVINQIATRRLRIVKYRGSTHGTNEYPFLIDNEGISVIPVTSLKLDYKSSNEIITTGLPALDRMFSLGGLYKGSTTLITGGAGTSKTMLAAYFALSACKRGERVLYFSFEESPDQLVRNLATVGINLKPHIKSKSLTIHASRPSIQGLEMHLMTINKLLSEVKPNTVIIDPISSLVTIGSESEVRGMLIRLMDTLKMQGINGMFTSLSYQVLEEGSDSIIEMVSSLSDVWIALKNSRRDNQKGRNLLIIKARGMGHENNNQPFEITSKGIRFLNEQKNKLSTTKSK